MAFKRLINFKTAELWADLLEKAYDFHMDRSELIYAIITKGLDEIRHLKKRPKWLNREDKP